MDRVFPTYIKLLGKKRANRQYRFKDIIKSGAVFTLGADWPASGDFSTFHILDEIEIAHTRQSLGKPNAPILPPVNQRLELKELIKAATLNGAIQMGQENQIGSIEVGKLADLIVLKKNIFDAKPDDIHKIKILLTMMNGKIKYRDPQFK